MCISNTIPCHIFLIFSLFLKLRKKTYDIHIQLFCNTKLKGISLSKQTFCSTALKFQIPRTVSNGNH
jgi:hypothetical protein